LEDAIARSLTTPELSELQKSALEASTNKKDRGLTPVEESGLYTAATKTNDRIASTAESRSLTLPPLNILVVEEDIASQTLIRRILEKEGHQVTVAGHGLEALNRLDDYHYFTKADPTNSPFFDLVLMDMEMPIMGGIEATQTIREREKGLGKHLPIIAVTSNPLKGNRERFLAAGLDEYVAKPVSVALLFSTIELVLNKITLAKPPSSHHARSA